MRGLSSWGMWFLLMPHEYFCEILKISRLKLSEVTFLTQIRVICQNEIFKFEQVGS